MVFRIVLKPQELGPDQSYFIQGLEIRVETLTEEEVKKYLRPRWIGPPINPPPG